MYRVKVTVDSLGEGVYSNICTVERQRLDEALIRATSYIEAELMGHWFSAPFEPTFLGVPFHIEVSHVDR